MKVSVNRIATNSALVKPTKFLDVYVLDTKTRDQLDFHPERPNYKL